MMVNMPMKLPTKKMKIIIKNDSEDENEDDNFDDNLYASLIIDTLYQ